MSGRLVPVESVVPGDRVLLPLLGPHEVVAVKRYDEPLGELFVVVYRAGTEASIEHRRSGRSGVKVMVRKVERGLRPLRRGELVRVAGGKSRRRP